MDNLQRLSVYDPVYEKILAGRQIRAHWFEALVAFGLGLIGWFIFAGLAHPNGVDMSDSHPGFVWGGRIILTVALIIMAVNLFKALYLSIVMSE